MSELIKRAKQAILDIERDSHIDCICYDNGTAAIIEELARKVEALESAWISVDERLPKYGDEFLGFSDGDIDHYIMNEDCVWNKNSGNLARKDIFDYVTHWMPLPPHPKEASDGNPNP